MKNLLSALLLLAAATLHAQNEDTSKVKKPVAIPKGFTKQLDVVYTQVDGWDGKMDIYLPPKSGKPTPVIINIHGGGWNHGAKEDQGGFSSFFKAGYAVANMEYRLIQRAPAPAAVEDVRCALIYLIKNAAALNINPNKIVIGGSSAGGHLALMGGLLGNNHIFDTNCPGVENIKVAAIIDKYGAADFVVRSGLKDGKNSAYRWLGPHAGDARFTASVSPLNYVTKDSPPIFIVHGSADPLVPYQQSVTLHDKLLSLGVKTEFITVDGGGHGKFPKDKMTDISIAIIAFLKGLGI